MSELIATKEYLLKAVGAVINSREIPKIPEDINQDLLIELVVKNSLQAIGYIAFAKQDFKYNDRLEKSYRTVVAREISQQAEADKIRKEFSENGIDFMFLKGSHLKKLYPLPELRFMADMDVLVRLNDVEKAKEILLSHGFEQKMDNGKDIVLTKKPFLTVELHNTLFVEDYYLYDYFLSVWDKAQKISEHEYAMTDSDMYIYTMAHLAEHFTTGGACFRPTMDIYLMCEKMAETLDFTYIEKEFQNLSLEDFAKKIKAVSKQMFSECEKDRSLEITENFIVLGPPVKNTGVANLDGKKRSKAQNIFKSLFPSLKHMKLLFPVLEKAPVLLPLFWIVRLVERVFSKTAREKFVKIKSADQKDIEIMERIYRESGIKKI